MQAIELDEVQVSLNRVKTALLQESHSTVELTQTVCHHLLNLGGKRLRARLVLIATGACQKPIHLGEKLAMIVEWLHTATLLHDDVIDQADQRRHQKAAKTLWGNHASILGGDYLYALAFQHIATLDHPKTIRALAQATSAIVEGEMQQLAHKNQLHLNRTPYLNIISGKTAKLFEVSASLPAIYLDAPPATIQALSQFGHLFGLAYQIIDDILDYQSTDAQSGKIQYTDLNAGTCTLPLILLSEQATPSLKNTIQQALKGSLAAQETVKQSLLESCALKDAWKIAQQFTQDALAHLAQVPESSYTQHMRTLLTSLLDRDH